MYTWLEIDLNSLKSNISLVKEIVGKTVKIMAVIKQNAYGHGLIETARHLDRLNVDFLGVNSKDEALSVVSAKVKPPVLILSNVLDSRLVSGLIKKNVRFSVMDKSLLNLLDSEAKKLARQALVHIKVDTGMNRLGVAWEHAADFIHDALNFKNIAVEGVFSHFSSADNDRAYTLEQLKRFKSVVGRLKFRPGLLHIANSSATLQYEGAYFDMVRTGLIIYGVNPVADTKPEHNLRPLLSLKTKILQIKEIKAGSFVSYAKTFRAGRNMLIGVLDAGYAHGYPWNLSNRGYVLIQGRKKNILGRVCMDHIVIDLAGDYSLKPGDEALLLGSSAGGQISVLDLASQARTIPYEILTRFCSSIQRVYV